MGMSTPSSSGAASRCRAKVTGGRRRDRRAGSGSTPTAGTRQAGYFILPQRLDLAGRYAFVDYNRSVSRGGVSVISAQTSYYFRRNSLKVVFDYSRTHRKRPSGQPANDSAFIIQAQLMP